MKTNKLPLQSRSPRALAFGLERVTPGGITTSFFAASQPPLERGTHRAEHEGPLRPRGLGGDGRGNRCDGAVICVGFQQSYTGIVQRADLNMFLDTRVMLLGQIQSGPPQSTPSRQIHTCTCEHLSLPLAFRPFKIQGLLKNEALVRPCMYLRGPPSIPSLDPPCIPSHLQHPVLPEES